MFHFVYYNVFITQEANAHYTIVMNDVPATVFVKLIRCFKHLTKNFQFFALYTAARPCTKKVFDLLHKTCFKTGFFQYNEDLIKV